MLRQQADDAELLAENDDYREEESLSGARNKNGVEDGLLLLHSSSTTTTTAAASDSKNNNKTLHHVLSSFQQRLFNNIIMGSNSSSAAGTTTSSHRHVAFWWLLFWTVNNIGVTLINKAAFALVHFPFPYAMTAIHMAICGICCHFIFQNIENSSTPKDNPWVLLLGDELLTHVNTHRRQQQQNQQRLDVKSTRLMMAFSFLFTMNIAMGNLSLRHVSVNFNQIMRSLVPVITLWISLYILKKSNVSLSRQRAVWPVVLGVALACFGDRMTIRNTIGLLSTIMCVLLASAKVVFSNEIMTGHGLKLHPVVLLSYLSPAALVQCVLLSVLSGEAAEISVLWSTELSPLVDWKPTFILLVSGLLAFSLNISALQAYKLTSPLTCCIAAAVKQVLMIVLGTILFQTVVTPLNALGIVVVLAGSAYYSYLSVQEQMNDKQEEEHEQDDLETNPATTARDEEEGVALLMKSKSTPSPSSTGSMEQQGTVTRR